MTNNISSVQRSVEKLKDNIKDNVEEAVHDSMGEGTGGVAWALKLKLRQNRSDATHTLRRSITKVPLPPSSSNEFVRVGIVAAPYWKYHEFGTGIYTSRGYSAPDVAPYQPIYRWIRAKGITPRPSSDDINTQADLAYAIQRSVSRGTQSKPFVRPVWRSKAGKENVRKAIDEAVNEAINSV
jgi:hypothetical protein